MRTRLRRSMAVLFLSLALTSFVPSAYGEGEGWIPGYLERLEDIRAEAARKIEATDRALDRADGVLSLAREENDLNAVEVAQRARSVALGAKKKYQRVLDRATVSLENTRRLSALASGDPSTSLAVGVVFSAGKVEIRRSSEPGWTGFGEEDGLLRPGDSIRTGPGGSVELRLMADGSRIDLGPGTTLNYRDENTAVLDLGKILSKISRQIEKRLRRFEVKTPTAVCAIRGTEFAVFTAPDGATTLSVLDGEVEFSGPDGKDPVTVSANQESVIFSEGVPSPPREIDPAGIRNVFGR